MKNTLLIIGFLVSLLLIYSCSDDSSPEPEIVDLRSLTPDEEVIVNSSNNFALNLFSAVNASYPDQNVFISPFSVSSALSMTLNGAGGDTQTAIKETLDLGDLSNDEINHAYRELVSMLLSMDHKVTMEIANSVWYKDILNIKTAFEQILSEYYSADVKSADFGDSNTVDQINDWIEDKTHGKIQNMLDRISADAVMYLINAIYFKADWTYQFDKNQTSDANFHLSDGSTIQVPTMYSEGTTLGLSISDEGTLLDIPYGNGQFSFTVVIPDETIDINEMANQFSMNDLTQLLEDTTQQTVELYMPKFKIEFKDLLNQSLTDMNMGIAFDPERADFSNLFDEQLQLYISRVIHQSFLEVSEEGSEAAAATIVEVAEYSAAATPSLVKIDRPFLFYIR